MKYNPDGSIAAYNKKRETREFRGKTYLLEEAFEMADFAWIKATKADKMGNCIFKGTSYNFNAIMASKFFAGIVLIELTSLRGVKDHDCRSRRDSRNRRNRTGARPPSRPLRESTLQRREI